MKMILNRSLGTFTLQQLFQLQYIYNLTMLRIHQDIQPANILVFPGDTGSPYDVYFKLADFGLTEVVRVTGEGETFPVNNEGNKMYCTSLFP